MASFNFRNHTRNINAGNSAQRIKRDRNIVGVRSKKSQVVGKIGELSAPAKPISVSPCFGLHTQNEHKEVYVGSSWWQKNGGWLAKNRSHLFFGLAVLDGLGLFGQGFCADQVQEQAGDEEK